MSGLLDDPLNVELLKLVCAGEGIEINVSELAEHFRKHRNTVSSRIDTLFEYGIADRPFHPLPFLFEQYPFLVIEKCDFPRDKKTNKWIEVDPYIWAAFFFRDEEYNTLLVELHKDLFHYQTWKDRIVDEGLVSIIQGREYIHSEAIYVHTKAIIKYDPSSALHVFKRNQQDGIHDKINDLEIDDTYLNLLEALIRGRGVWTNPSALARKLGIHRRTVQRRLKLLLDGRIISPAVSRFPRVWVPPQYFMVVSLLDIKTHKERIQNTLAADPHVSFLAKATAGRYNYLTVAGFYRMEDHLNWEEEYGQRFSGSIGAIKNIYLSPAMTFSIHQQYVALAYLDQLSNQLRGKKLLSTIHGYS
jgi:DNA-binding transcriptional ArsR family regulator